jgi:hypothetical protein
MRNLKNTQKAKVVESKTVTKNYFNLVQQLKVSHYKFMLHLLS